MRVLVAMDSMKGSLGSLAAGEAVAEGVRRVFPDAECTVLPLADGGEGTVEALAAGMGGAIRKVEVSGPLGAKVQARYGIVGDLAIMEMAEAAGITLISPEERNPLLTTTYGVGELVLDALSQGCKRFVIGIGGSATNDGGAGMLQALGFRLLDGNGCDIGRGGAELAKLAVVEKTCVPALETLAPGAFRIACDVTNPLCGDNGASAVYGPQKGADGETVRQLDRALAHFAEVSGGDADFPGAGAAGGLGFAFRTFLGAELKRGVELVLDEIGFDGHVAAADVVVTGEGRLDAQTAMGKAPAGVAAAAKRRGKMVVAFSGCLGDGAGKVNECGIDAFFPIVHAPVALEEALSETVARRNLANTAEQAFRLVAASMQLER
jgi:glycerate kinase